MFYLEFFVSVATVFVSLVVVVVVVAAAAPPYVDLYLVVQQMG